MKRRPPMNETQAGGCSFNTPPTYQRLTLQNCFVRKSGIGGGGHFGHPLPVGIGKLHKELFDDKDLPGVTVLVTPHL